MLGVVLGEGRMARLIAAFFELLNMIHPALAWGVGLFLLICLIVGFIEELLPPGREKKR